MEYHDHILLLTALLAFLREAIATASPCEVKDRALILGLPSYGTHGLRPRFLPLISLENAMQRLLAWWGGLSCAERVAVLALILQAIDTLS